MRSAPKNMTLKVSTFVVLTACFSVMLTSLLVASNFKNILTMWGEDVQMTVYLAPTVNEQRRESIQAFLQRTGKVGSITYISAEKALTDFRAQLASYAPDLGQDDDLLKVIPASFQVKLASSVPAQEQMQVLQDLSLRLKSWEGIDDISYGQDWVEKYGALVSTIEYTMQALGMVIMVASMFVMSNAIRASVQNRHDEISVLEMIGATYSYIRKPFLLEGALLGGASAAIATVICFLAYVATKNLLVTKLSFIQLGQYLSFISPLYVIGIIVGGTILGAFGSYICVRNINDGWASSSRTEVRH